MVGELLPLKSLVIVDINLSEQLYQVLAKACLVLSLWQVMQHDLDELLNRKSLLLVLHEVLLDLLQLPVIQMTHYVVVILVKVLVLLYKVMGG